MEKIKPIVITINDDEGNPKEVYTLEFSRESVIFTNKIGFKASEIEDNPEEMIPLLFYGAFRKNHRNISRQQADNILFECLGGMNRDVLERLIALYGEPRASMFKDEEDDGKNARATVVL